MSETKRFFQGQGMVGSRPPQGQTTVPWIQPTSKGDVLKFTLLVPDGYGEGSNLEYVNCAIFNEGLIAEAQKELYGGSKGIYVEGTLTEKPGNTPGKVFRDLNVSRIGIVNFFQRSARNDQPVAVAAAAADSDADF